MRNFAISLALLLMSESSVFAQDYSAEMAQFFKQVQDNEMEKATGTVKKLAAIPEEKLKAHLDSEDKAKSFWLNAYNTFAQYLLKQDRSRFDDRNKFFSDELITIANHKLSLDDIEHGIIRSSKNKYSMGYVSKFSVGDFEKKFRLEKIDYRIHFALNCGAKSCPPIALYVSDRIDEQLDKSSSAYLKNNTKYNEQKNQILVPKLCSWFKADFGGEDGVREMLKKYKIIKKDLDPDIEYLDYDWTLSLSNYVTF
jgi:hypothetical protein